MKVPLVLVIKTTTTPVFLRFIRALAASTVNECHTPRTLLYSKPRVIRRACFSNIPKIMQICPSRLPKLFEPTRTLKSVGALRALGGPQKG